MKQNENDFSNEKELQDQRMSSAVEQWVEEERSQSLSGKSLNVDSKEEKDNDTKGKEI